MYMCQVELNRYQSRLINIFPELLSCKLPTFYNFFNIFLKIFYNFFNSANMVKTDISWANFLRFIFEVVTTCDVSFRPALVRIVPTTLFSVEIRGEWVLREYMQDCHLKSIVTCSQVGFTGCSPNMHHALRRVILLADTPTGTCYRALTDKSGNLLRYWTAMVS